VPVTVPREEFRVLAPAKINLYLHVTGRRENGYHELDSLIAFADIGDMVGASEGEALSLAIEGPFAAPLVIDPAENLVLRAARCFAERAGVPARARLRLVKNLPIASGIGGGSSDAAATLHALGRLWRCRLDQAELDDLAAELGADVPVCLHGRPAWAGGIGERIEPAPLLPPAAVVLVNPGIALPTPAVFKARTGPFSAPARWRQAAESVADLAALLSKRRNDLTEAAISIVPAIAEVLAWLDRQEGVLLARMSGSGATCFALCTDAAAADAVSAAARREYPFWWAVAGRLAGVETGATRWSAAADHVGR
jgi:4-diphosphocytidyl-2-C-methyl-D-erythritol kinase